MRDGVLIDTQELMVVDTNERAWEPNPGIPGARMKTLARHPDGWESLILNWLPPDLGGGDPHRHYHRMVRERGLVLDGELPMVEFVAGEPGPGVAVMFRAGFYMDRAPGCVHGLDPRRTSRSGFTILEWRDGPGTYLMEAQATTESVVEDAPAEVGELKPDGRPGVVIERDDLTLLDTFALPWLDAPDEPGVRVQQLSGGVTIAYGGPDAELLLGAEPNRRALVLAGSVKLNAEIGLGAGGFLELHSGIPTTAVAGAVGCRVLRF